jgi:pyrimidine-nucleoside phosphorylase
LAEELRDGEVREITSAVRDGKIPLHQLSAFLMSVYFQRMSVQETVVWTEALILSGDVAEN